MKDLCEVFFMTCALLVIDMQKAIFELKQPVFEQDALLRSVKTAISIAHTSGIRIIFTKHENKSFLKKGTPGYEIVDGIGVREDDIITEKKHPAVFLDTGLNEILKSEGIKTLFVAGLISNGCVKHACLSAMERGYTVYLLSDAHSTIYKNAARIIKDISREMEAAGVKLLPVEQLAKLFGEIV